MIYPFVYVPKAACEEQALGRGTKAGDDFIQQHPILPAFIGTSPCRQLCRPGSITKTHEMTINCLQRIALIPDRLKTYKHILPQWYWQLQRDSQCTRNFFHYMAVKPKPLRLLPNLIKVYMDLVRWMWKIISNILGTGPYTSLHLSSASFSF